MKRLRPTLFVALLALLAGPAHAARQTCSVVNLYDGDTLTVACPGSTKQTKVRLACIDAPEQLQAPWGNQARATLASKIGGAWHRWDAYGKTWLYADSGQQIDLRVVGTDPYDRSIGWIYPVGKWTPFNRQLVAGSRAAVYPEYCQIGVTPGAESMWSAQTAAQSRSPLRGIWASPPLPGLQQTPWLYRNP